MAFLTIAGVAALRARLSMPLSGLWLVDALLDADTAPTGVVACSAPGFDGSGTVVRGDAIQGRAAVRIVAGKGALATPLAPRWYSRAPARVIALDVLRDSGELLASSSAIPDVELSWARSSLSAAATLEQLAGVLGIAWRALDDGSIWLGAETWPAVAEVPMVLETDDGLGWRRYEADALTLRPGMLLEGRRVVRVRHAIDDNAVTSIAWTAAA